MANDPLEDMETAVDFVSAELDGVSEDLSHVGREIMDILRRDLISRDGYLIVLIMVLLTVVMIAVGRRLHRGPGGVGGDAGPAGADHAEPVPRVADASASSAGW